MILYINSEQYEFLIITLQYGCHHHGFVPAKVNNEQKTPVTACMHVFYYSETIDFAVHICGHVCHPTTEVNALRPTWWQIARLCPNNGEEGHR